jgi:hypothetical protein
VTSVTERSSFPPYKVLNIVRIGVLAQPIKRHKIAAVDRVLRVTNLAALPRDTLWKAGEGQCRDLTLLKKENPAFIKKV